MRSLTFVGTTPKPRHAAPLTQQRYSIFDGIQLPFIDKGNVTEEVGNEREARIPDEARSRVVECNLPLGIEFEEKDGGDIYIKNVQEGSDAWDQGIRKNAQVVMISATFGDEMWTTRQVGMRQLMTVIGSRFGSTIKLALEKENTGFLDGFFNAFAAKPESQEDEEKKEKRLMGSFEAEEAGYCVGSIEGRCGVQHFPNGQPGYEKKNFAFKCHRKGDEVYPVNALTFHKFGTFATCGGDGCYTFWDKNAKQRLKAFTAHRKLPITDAEFTPDGNFFVYTNS